MVKRLCNIRQWLWSKLIDFYHNFLRKFKFWHILPVQAEMWGKAKIFGLNLSFLYFYLNTPFLSSFIKNLLNSLHTCSSLPAVKRLLKLGGLIANTAKASDNFWAFFFLCSGSISYSSSALVSQVLKPWSENLEIRLEFVVTNG